jgi:hypothetical protein
MRSFDVVCLGFSLVAALALPACEGEGKQEVEDLAAPDHVAEQVSRDDAQVELSPPCCDALDSGLDGAWPEETAADEPSVEEVAAEVLPDTKIEELVPLAEAAFRIAKMEMLEPQFCYPFNDDCLPLLSEVNSMLDQDLQAGVLNLVGVFEPFGPGEVVTLTMAMADCNLDDPPSAVIPYGYCMFKDGALPATYQDVAVAAFATCGSAPSFDPPCFATGWDDLALEFNEVVLGLSNVALSGHVADWPPDGKLSPARLSGYLPEEIAKTVQVQVPMGEMLVIVSLYKLLEMSASEPEVVDGHLAWPVVIDFEAEQVGFLE